jgi:hypothetical protein
MSGHNPRRRYLLVCQQVEFLEMTHRYRLINADYVIVAIVEYQGNGG